MHKERMFDNQELPKKVEVNIVKSLESVGGSINGLCKSKLTPNCRIETFDGDVFPSVWYPHTGIPKSQRYAVRYESLDFKGNKTEYSFIPSGWILTENRWLPLVTRLLRVVGAKELEEVPNLLNRVTYDGKSLDVNELEIKNGNVKLLTSLGAADNPFFITYLSSDKNGNLLPSVTKNNWLILDTKSIGYKSCGVGERVYGPGCYFGGSWSCADRGSAKKVDTAVCKIKNPPWPTRYFWATIDDIVFNAGEGGSIKSGRIKLLNEDQNQKIPDWVKPII